MTAPPIDVSPHEWQIIQDILRKHVPDREVWAFGSRAKRTAWAYSDLDLTIMAPLSWNVRSDMGEEFSESDLPFRVDMLDWATTTDDFRRIVDHDKVLIKPASCVPSAADPATDPEQAR